MFYRYEALIPQSPWIGVCQLFNPDNRRKFGRYLREPKYYKSHPGCKSTCWFTEYGFHKYGSLIEEIIGDWTTYQSSSNLPGVKIRLISVDNIPNPLRRGKCQWIAPENTSGQVLWEKDISEFVM